MNLRKFTNLIRSSKNPLVGLSLTMLIVTAAFQVHGVSQQQKNYTRTSQAMTNNSQPIKPITIENTDKMGIRKQILPSVAIIKPLRWEVRIVQFKSAIPLRIN
ncbi:MAG: hypothetical protein HC903_06680 [Methylacidiphilales bacterium]|nr:hypothetical protein [Candidatus Methylacidiphilales bacterium]NJR15978.1 hypothetical protein [Calothrix sp. CSU_2_0]